MLETLANKIKTLFLGRLHSSSSGRQTDDIRNKYHYVRLHAVTKTAKKGKEKESNGSGKASFPDTGMNEEVMCGEIQGRPFQVKRVSNAKA